MRKLIYLGIVTMVLATIGFVSCEKEDFRSQNKIQNVEETNGSEIDEKAASSTSCSVSCFWSSFSVTCNDNVGVAACACVNIWGGLLGSSAVCACGGAGTSSASVSFSEEHINRHNILIDVISSSDLKSRQVNSLRNVSRKIVKHSTNNNGNSFGRNRVLMTEFVEAAENLKIHEAEYIGGELRLRLACADLPPINE